jgi:hypothetical protein
VSKGEHDNQAWDKTFTSAHVFTYADSVASPVEPMLKQCQHQILVVFLSAVAAFEEVVGEEFLAEVDVGHDHASTAVPCEAQGVHGVAFGVLCLEEVEVDLPPEERGAGIRGEWGFGSEEGRTKSGVSL